MVSSILKEDMNNLPQEVFEGKIIVIQTEKDAVETCKFLKTQKALGFDTETRPNFKKGSNNKIALMQIATMDTCFLFRLNIINIPDCLAEILINPNIKKIGLSLKDDFSAIRKTRLMELSNFVDVQILSGKYGIEDNSLQKIYAILFNRRISKRQRLSNWEAEKLTDAQQMYAAIDAWACLKIYQKLLTKELVKDN